jgi:hypothetical protein
MTKNKSATEPSFVSTEVIIDVIRKTRDEQIRGVLSAPDLPSFLQVQYNVPSLTPVKAEFLKRDLKELHNSTLDLVHYASLIREMKEANVMNPDGSHPLFQSELKSIFNKYGF